jgi:hypothetical protein
MHRKSSIRRLSSAEPQGLKRANIFEQDSIRTNELVENILPQIKGKGRSSPKLPPHSVFILNTL